jgi:hypothetical protein
LLSRSSSEDIRFDHAVQWVFSEPLRSNDAGVTFPWNISLILAGHPLRSFKQIAITVELQIGTGTPFLGPRCFYLLHEFHSMFVFDHPDLPERSGGTSCR